MIKCFEERDPVLFASFTHAQRHACARMSMWADLIYIPGDLAHYAADQEFVWNIAIYKQKARKERGNVDVNNAGSKNLQIRSLENRFLTTKMS